MTSDSPIDMSITYFGMTEFDTLKTIEDMMVLLKCSSSSNPAANYSWTYPGGYVTGSTLTLQFNRNNTGEFTCQANNTMLSTYGQVQGLNKTAVNILVLCK